MKKTGGSSMNLEQFLYASLGKLRNIIVILLVVVLIAVFALGQYTSGLYKGPYQETVDIYALVENLNTVQGLMYFGLITYDYDYLGVKSEQLPVLEEAINEEFESVIASASDEQRPDFERAFEMWTEMIPYIDESSKYANTMLPGEDENMWETAQEIFEENVMDDLDECITIVSDSTEAFTVAAAEYAKKATIVRILILAAIVLAGAYILLTFRKSIANIINALLIPMREITEKEAELAKGDISIRVTYNEEDELGDVSRSTNHVAAVIGEMVEEANKIAQGAVDGNLSVRGDADKFEGGFRELIQGFNNALDAMTAPLATASEAINAIGEGIIPDPIAEEAKGDFAIIMNSLNKCINTVNTLVSDTGMLVEAAKAGNITERPDATVHSGAFGDIIRGVNEAMDSLVEHINLIPIPVTIVDKNMNVLFMNKVSFANTGKENIDEVRNHNCADCSYSMLCGTDRCVAAVAMATGEKAIEATTATFGGQQHSITYTAIPIKNDAGEVVAALELSTDETEVKAAMQEAEKQSERAAKRADFLATEVQKVIVNLDRLAAGNLDLDTSMPAVDPEFEDIAENFSKINGNLDKTKEAISNLIKDADGMVSAAVAGNLDSRADIKRHGGQFADVMRGFNETLDAVVEPIKEAENVLRHMAEGDLSVRMTGMYNGEYADIKAAVNKTAENMQATVAEISDILASIGSGDLTVSVSGNYQGDFVAIKDSLNDILGSLSSIMKQINQASDDVATGSKEVSGASQALSNSSVQQAASIQELTAAVADVASQTKQNAEAAAQASQLSLSAQDSARRGNDRMKDMLSSMNEISEASQSISKVIKVIDDIAFQTNILALNAAVEAARAGVHGKGFAVVADEVRNLAAKSAEAAAETTALIEGSIAKSDRGADIAGETAEALKEIYASVEESASLVKKIAEASDKQNAGIQRIDAGLGEVAKGVQANSATSEESAAASADLHNQAAGLKRLVDTFKLESTGEMSVMTDEVLLIPGRV